MYQLELKRRKKNPFFVFVSLKSFTRSLERFYLGIDEEQSTMSGYMVITLEDPDGGENKYSCNLEKGIEDLKYPVDYDFEGLILECTKSV